MKLTDTQLVLLSKAAQRADLAVDLPANLKGGAAQKVMARLLSEGLLEEVRAPGEMPVWRRDEENRPLGLRITQVGLQGIQAIEDGDDGQTEAVAALGASKRRARRQRGHSAKLKRRATKKKLQEAGAVGPESKQSVVLALLSRARGATVAAIMDATGWQAHTVRGFFAGVVRRKLGLKLVSEEGRGGRVYRIAGQKNARRAA